MSSSSSSSSAPSSTGPSGALLSVLVGIMQKLRADGGCPWDREQTHETLKPYMIEEAYEAADAIDSGDPAKLCEELGDVLLQVVFHAQVAREAGCFDIDDVIRGIADKLVRRHPHVFGGVTVDGTAGVLRNWELIKRSELAAAAVTATGAAEAEAPPEPCPSIASGIPRSLPALMATQKVQEKAARVGFDWSQMAQVVDKLKEEVRELEEALNRNPDGGPEAVDELGDIMFMAVNLARFLRVQAEQVLRDATRRFCQRFDYIERRGRQMGTPVGTMSLDEMQALWDEYKVLSRSHQAGGHPGAKRQPGNGGRGGGEY